jgi:hypothetical protein
VRESIAIAHDEFVEQVALIRGFTIEEMAHCSGIPSVNHERQCVG